MKKLFFPVFVLFLFVLNSCGPSTEQAIEYNDALVDEHAAVSESIQSLFTDISSFNLGRIDEDYKNAETTIQNAIENTDELGDFNGESTYKEVFMDYLKWAQKIMGSEVKQIIEILKLGDRITAEDEEKLNKMIELIYLQEKTSNKKLMDEQENFSEKYNFDIN